MTTRIIQTAADLRDATKWLEGMKKPFTIDVTKGKHRTVAQNRLQFQWLNEISEQLGDQTPEEVRGYCKLTLGVPILRAENERFRKQYDEVLKPLSYEQKLAIMMEPLDLPVTRLFTTRQKTLYLDAMQRHFAEQGIRLTDPEGALA